MAERLGRVDRRPCTFAVAVLQSPQVRRPDFAQSHQPSSADDVRRPLFAARSPSLFPTDRPEEHDLFELLEREISRHRYMPHQLLVPPGETYDRRRAFPLFLFLYRFFFSLSHHSTSLPQLFTVPLPQFTYRIPFCPSSHLATP